MNKCLIKLTGIALGILCMLTVHAQVDVIRGNTIADHLLIKQRESITNPPEIDGTPYGNDSFQLGNVYTLKGIFKNVAMRQDLYNGWIEFREKGIIYILDAGPNIIKVVLNSDTLYTQPIFKDGKMVMGYFNKLDDGNVKLFKQHSIKFIEKPPVKAYTSTNIPAKFAPEPDKFFFRVANAESKPIVNIKKMIELFPDHQKELNSYLKRKKVGINEEDLLLLWAYYNKF